MRRLRGDRTGGVRFVSGQPDDRHFLWQTEIYLRNFLSLGIEPGQCSPVFGVDAASGPSPELRELARAFPGVDFQFHPDTRGPEGRAYTPSLQPHIWERALLAHPEWARAPVFYHDSDIAFRRLPDLPLALSRYPDACVLSDTVNYIGYRYIHGCCEKISAANLAVPPDHLFRVMCACVGIAPEDVEKRDAVSGGAQYLLRGVDAGYWAKVYRDSLAISRLFDGYARENALESELKKYIQVWTAGMWAFLWNLWLRGLETAIDAEMAFVFANAGRQTPAPIIHVTGAPAQLRAKHFCKRTWGARDPIATVRAIQFAFDHIATDTASGEYVEIIRSIAGVPPPPVQAAAPARCWRLLTWQTESGFAWDVGRVVFEPSRPAPVVEYLESGSAGPAFGVANAFAPAPGRVWGGRPCKLAEGTPCFFLGAVFAEPVLPLRVSLVQPSESHRSSIVLLQGSPDGVSWTTAVVAELNPGPGEQTVYYRSDRAVHARCWRVMTRVTKSGTAWDIRRLAFLDSQDEQTGTAFASGFAAVEGTDRHRPERAFEAGDGIWGGRPDGDGRFFLGLQSPVRLRVNRVLLEQSSAEHVAPALHLQCSDDGERWYDVVTRTDLVGGVDNVLVFDEPPPGPRSVRAGAPRSSVVAGIRLALAPGAAILEVAPGPDGFARELPEYALDAVGGLAPDALLAARGLYAQVYFQPVRDFAFDRYDLVIVDGVLEEMAEEEARSLLARLVARCPLVILGGPLSSRYAAGLRMLAAEDGYGYFVARRGA